VAVITLAILFAVGRVQMTAGHELPIGLNFYKATAHVFVGILIGTWWQRLSVSLAGWLAGGLVLVEVVCFTITRLG
jgi:hypothetical protein